MADDGQETRETIEHYFHRGYKYDEIVLFLGKYHGIKMCTRTLKRRLRDYGLKKSGNDGEVNDGHVIATIQEIMNEAGSLSGYRTVWHALRRRYGIHISRQKVARIIKELDPLGVEARKARRLQRREYISYGPNFCWHMDGKCELKISQILQIEIKGITGATFQKNSQLFYNLCIKDPQKMGRRLIITKVLLRACNSLLHKSAELN